MHRITIAILVFVAGIQAVAGAEGAKSTKKCPSSLDLGGTLWQWDGSGGETIRFKKDGFVENAGWTKRGLKTKWTVIDSRTVLLHVTAGRKQDLYAVLKFNNDMSAFSGSNFHGGSLLRLSYKMPERPKRVYLPFKPQEPLAQVVYTGPLEVDTLHEGVRAFSNRGYKFLNVPFDLRSLKFIRHAGGKHKKYSLNVKEAGLLLAAIWEKEPTDNLLALNGWQPTGMTFYYNDQGGSRLRVWMKQVKKGTEKIPFVPGFIGTIVISPSFTDFTCVKKDMKKVEIPQSKKPFRVHTTRIGRGGWYGSIAVEDGYIYLATKDGNLRRGKLSSGVHTEEIGHGGWFGSIAVEDGYIYLATFKGDLRKGKLPPIPQKTASK